MTVGGWVVMVLSVGSVLGLVSYCLCRVLALPPVDIEQHQSGSGHRFPRYAAELGLRLLVA